MTASTAPAPIQIAFPKVDEGSKELAIPPAPILPVNTGMQTIATAGPTGREQLACKDLLQGATRTQAEIEAANLYPKMLNSTPLFMTFGTGALDGVNKLIDELMHQVSPVKIPELTKIMRGLNDGMRQIKIKYDVSDPNVREKYENWRGGIARLWGQGKTLIEMLTEDFSSIETQLDRVVADLRGKQIDLTRYVTYYDELYARNEEEVKAVIYAIAVMELIRDLAIKDAQAIEVGDASRGDRAGEEKAALAQFAENMNIKIAEYKGRLIVAWATSPNVRMMRNVDVTVAERLNELVCVTIPTMRATVVQWRMLMQAMDAAKFVQLVSGASNETLKMFFAASGQLIPVIMEAAETPTMSLETITAMVDSLAAASQGIVDAVTAGTQRRAELDDAIAKARRAMDTSTHKMSEEIIEQVVGAATRPLEIATHIGDKSN